MAAIRIVGMITLGAIILGLMALSSLFCGSPRPPASPKIVGFNCDERIYEDRAGRTFERGADGHFVRMGK